MGSRQPSASNISASFFRTPLGKAPWSNTAASWYTATWLCYAILDVNQNCGKQTASAGEGDVVSALGL